MFRVWASQMFDINHPHISRPLALQNMDNGLPVIIVPFYAQGNILRYVRDHPYANKADLVCAVGTSPCSVLTDVIVTFRLEASSLA